MLQGRRNDLNQKVNTLTHTHATNNISPPPPHRNLNFFQSFNRINPKKKKVQREVTDPIEIGGRKKEKMGEGGGNSKPNTNRNLLKNKFFFSFATRKKRGEKEMFIDAHRIRNHTINQNQSNLSLFVSLFLARLNSLSVSQRKVFAFSFSPHQTLSLIRAANRHVQTRSRTFRFHDHILARKSELFEMFLRHIRTVFCFLLHLVSF